MCSCCRLRCSSCRKIMLARQIASAPLVLLIFRRLALSHQCQGLWALRFINLNDAQLAKTFCTYYFPSIHFLLTQASFQREKADCFLFVSRTVWSVFVFDWWGEFECCFEVWSFASFFWRLFCVKNDSEVGLKWIFDRTSGWEVNVASDICSTFKSGKSSFMRMGFVFHVIFWQKDSSLDMHNLIKDYKPADVLLGIYLMAGAYVHLRKNIF